MKYIAKQIAPEYQESPLMMSDESFYEGIACYGNDDFNGFICDIDFKNVRDILEQGELCEMLREVANGDHYYFNTATEAINNYFPRKKKYSTKEIHNLKKLIAEYGDWNNDDDDTLCAVLSIVTGEPWENCELCGCVQRDWIKCAYRKNMWDKKSLDMFEMEYFNTGEEYIVSPEDDENENVSVYVYSWDDDEKKKEIADAVGCSSDEVELWMFNGWNRSARYEIA